MARLAGALQSATVWRRVDRQSGTLRPGSGVSLIAMILMPRSRICRQYGRMPAAIFAHAVGPAVGWDGIPSVGRDVVITRSGCSDSICFVALRPQSRQLT